MRRIKAASRVLGYRSLKKEDAELQAARARRRHGEEEEKLASMEKTLAETLELLQGGRKGAIINVHEFELMRDYCLHLDGRTDSQRARKEESLQELARRQEALVEAHKEERLLETLIERLDRERRRQAEADAQKESDALYLSRRRDDPA